MLGKILIQCNLKVLTGMHIGGINTYSAIGAVDKSVVRDTLTGLPMVPGSSLKGKMRSLLAQAEAPSPAPVELDGETEDMQRLFGSAQGKDGHGNAHAAQMQFSDAFMAEDDGTSHTEVKFENGINRLTSKANPRQIERVVRGTHFKIRITYDVLDQRTLKQDMELLAKGLKLLSLDYLGGHGSRGYGRVKFENFQVDQKVGTPSIDNQTMEEVRAKLKEVEQYAVFD